MHDRTSRVTIRLPRVTRTPENLQAHRLFGLWFTTTFHASTFSLSASHPYLAALPQWNILKTPQSINKYSKPRRPTHHRKHSKEQFSFGLKSIRCVKSDLKYQYKYWVLVRQWPVLQSQVQVPFTTYLPNMYMITKMCLCVCTLTFNQLLDLVLDPVRSWRLRPTSQRETPRRADWGQQSKRSPFRT